MPRIPPDHNAQRIFELVQTQRSYTGDDSNEIALYQLLTTNSCSLEIVEDAYDIYVDPDNRHIMDALILAKGSDDQIADALGMTAVLLAAYRYLFFDRSVFRHDLDVKNYNQRSDIPESKRAYYITACQRGFRTLANLFHVGERTPIDPKAAMQELLADQLDRARAHRGLQLDSDIAREALRWGQSACSTANILLRQDPQDGKNALEELKLALLTKDHTASVEELDITAGELYH